MSRRIKSNPEWSDAIMQKNCEQIRIACKEFDLPLPILDNKCRIEGELGYGAYGTVFRSEDESVVIKTTSDESEAHMIALAISMRQVDGIDPKGIVRYDGLFALPQKRDGANTFIAWRESAKSIGLRASESSSCEIKEFESMLLEYYKHAEAAFWAATDAAKDMPVNEYWAWLKADVEATNEILDGKRRDLPLLAPSLSRHLAKAYAIADELRNNTRGHYVGDALWTYAKAGLIIADTHLNNVGEVERGRCGERIIVLTDPGHLLVARRSLSEIEIPVLGENK